MGAETIRCANNILKYDIAKNNGLIFQHNNNIGSKLIGMMVLKWFYIQGYLYFY